MTPARTSAPSNAQWFVSTEAKQWQTAGSLPITPLSALPDVIVKVDEPKQSIEGFGACFNELGWTSLAELNEAQRPSVFHEIFAPGVGAGLSLCRMPVGANDFSRDWYSYDEVAGDFDLDHFDIGNDLDTLVPFIREAREHQAALRLWASP